MSDDPFLAQLEQRAQATPKASPPKPSPAKKPEPAGERERRALAFWQSPIANGFIRRRISGNESVGPAQHFASLTAEPLRAGAALSLRAGDTKLECDLLRHGACGSVTVIDDSADRLDYAKARIPRDLQGSFAFEQAEPLEFSPPDPLALVVANSALHRVPDPDAVVARFAGWLAPGGMVYVDEFVGPNRFQWTDAQIEIVNRLLSCLPEDLRRDLASEKGEVKTVIARPDPERFGRDHPAEAVAGERTRQALDAHLEQVAIAPYGGAVFHQLFARIMGNFAERPELVGLILEVDAILTDSGVVASDYLWAAYRRPD